jgi:hypothetical protein
MKTRLMATAVLTLLAAWPLASQAPVTHRLTPERFYNTFSFAHPPALKIRPGDRVVTKTIDASGTDWNGKSVAQGPNPQTGPFYVEGAEPGDAIVVTIERLETNRTTGFSSSLLAPYVVDPGSIANRVDRDPQRANWIIDQSKGQPGWTCPRSRRPSSCCCADARLPGHGARAQGSGRHEHTRHPGGNRTTQA